MSVREKSQMALRRDRNKIKRTKRQKCGYTEDEPDMCRNCAHYVVSLRVRTSVSAFPPRCSLHEFEVRPQAFCNDYARDDLPAPPIPGGEAK